MSEYCTCATSFDGSCQLHDRIDALTAENLSLREQVAALESREVCTVAHENVETCGYCQRDALAAENAALRKDAERYRHVWSTWPLTFGEMLQNGYGHYPIENKAQGDAVIDAALEQSHE